MPGQILSDSGMYGAGYAGILFGKPASSYDLNSMQAMQASSLLALRPGLGASCALLPWSSPSRNSLIRDIRASVRNPATGEIHTAWRQSVGIVLPSDTQDRYLYFCARFAAYAADAESTEYQPRYEGEYISDRLYRDGYRKSPATSDQEEEIENRIAENGIGTETSVRFGMEWKLCWEGSIDPEYTPVAPILLCRYADGYRALFSQGRDYGNSELLQIPCLYLYPLSESLFALDGLASMMLADGSQVRLYASIVFPKDTPVSASLHIVTGIKNAPNISLAYYLKDGTHVESQEQYRAVWERNRPYLFYFSGNELVYEDTSPSVKRVYPCLRYSYSYRGTRIDLSQEPGSIEIDCEYDSQANAYKPAEGNVYTIEGTGHYWDGQSWRTAGKPGTIVFSAVGNLESDGRAVCPPGYAVCDGSVLEKEIYPELYAVIGDSYSQPDTSEGFFCLPDLTYSSPYMRMTSSIQPESQRGGRDSATLTKSNIPQFQTETGKTKTGLSVQPSFPRIQAEGTAQLPVSALMEEWLKHDHSNGVVGWTEQPRMCNVYGEEVQTDPNSSPSIPYRAAYPPADYAWRYTHAGSSLSARNYDMSSSYSLAYSCQKESPSTARWGLTSKGKNAGGSTASKSLAVSVTVPASQGTATVTETAHSHSVTVGTASPTPVVLNPEYALLRPFICLGQPLISEPEGSGTQPRIFPPPSVPDTP